MQILCNIIRRLKEYKLFCNSSNQKLSDIKSHTVLVTLILGEKDYSTDGCQGDNLLIGDHFLTFHIAMRSE